MHGTNETSGENGDSEVALAALQGALPYLTELGVNVQRALKRYPNLKKYVAVPRSRLARLRVPLIKNLVRSVDVEVVQEFRETCNELFHMKDGAVAKVITNYPYTINAAREDIEKMVNYFMDLGIPRSGVATMVERHPQLIHYDLELNVKPTMSYLRDDLGITGGYLVKVCGLLDQVFGRSCPNSAMC